MKDKPKHPQYEYYKHVTVCKAWKSYEKFKRWALANGYTDDLLLDRKKNSKGYLPSNCRWVSSSMSNKNRRWTPKMQKHAEDMGKKSRVAVVCLDTGESFCSITEAAAAHGTYVGNICYAIAKKAIAGGVRWAYKADVEEAQDGKLPSLSKD